MRIKSFIAAAALATATVAGVSTAATATAAPATATTYQAADYGGTYYGTYATLEACSADGASPSTGGYYWECIESWEGWDLYIYY